MNTRLATALRAGTFPAVLLAGLEAWARTVGTGSDAIAPPTQALLAWVRAAVDGSLWSATALTLAAAAAGLAVGCSAGVLIGTWLGLSPRAAKAAFLSVEVLRPVPSVALIPLAMLIFGFGLRMELAIVAFATFWPMLVLAQAAARQVDPCLLEVAAALQLDARARFAKIVWPAMLPRLFVALRLAVAIALVVAVTVEIAANPQGMGYALIIAQQGLDPALMMAWLAWIGVVGYGTNAGAVHLQTWAARRLGGEVA